MDLDTIGNRIFEVYRTSYDKKFGIGSIFNGIGSRNVPFPQINGQFCSNNKPEYGDTYLGISCYYDNLRGYVTFNSPVSYCHNIATKLFETIKSVNTSINIYPNPAKDVLNIEIANNATIQIISLDGRLVKTIANMNSTNSQINVSELSQGVYFLRIQNGAEVINQKFVKE